MGLVVVGCGEALDSGLEAGLDGECFAVRALLALEGRVGLG